jgi:hypothetical protein
MTSSLHKVEFPPKLITAEKKPIASSDIDDTIRSINEIRSKCSKSNAYTAINILKPLLDQIRIILLDEYLLVVAQIAKNKKRLSRIQKKERQAYLIKLLTPLVKLNRLHQLGENPYLEHDGTYPFIDEKIWIEKEINIKELDYDEQKYSINFEYSKPFDWFDPDAKNIIIWDQYREYLKKKKKKDSEAKATKARGIQFIPLAPLDEGKVSLRELYEKWLPALSKNIIKNDDLLDHILVCFTIKRALNGDKKAIDKLYSLYEDAARGIAVKMAKKRGLDFRHIKDIKQDAKMLLRFLLSGYRPEDIISSLLDSDEKYLKVPLQIEKFYFWYYSDYVPKELDRIMTRKANRLDGLEINYLLNPISPIDDYTSWQNTPKRIVKFNSGSFKPGRGTNYITTWLFGANNNYTQGRFCQLISERIDGYWKHKGKEIGYDFSDGNNDKMDTIDLKKKKQVETAIVEKFQDDEESKDRIEDAIDLITKRNIFKRNTNRNIDIVSLKLRKHSYNEIANKYNITKRQVINICNKVKCLK